MNSVKQVTPKNKHLLVAEDYAPNLELLCDFLEFEGYQISSVTNGKDAIEQTLKLKPDLILMDVQMPGMDGLEATQIIRSTPEISHIPIICQTAFAMSGDCERCLDAGATAYLSKPIDFEQLKTLIIECLEKASS